MLPVRLLACAAPTSTEPTLPELPAGPAPDRSWFGALETSGLGQSVDLVPGVDTLPIVAMRGFQYCCEGSTVWRLDPGAPSGPIAQAAGAWVEPNQDSWRGVRFWPDLDGDGGPELAIDDGVIRFYRADQAGPTQENESWAEVNLRLPAETCGDLDGDGAEDLCGLEWNTRGARA